MGVRSILVQAQQWEQARAIIGMIEDNSVRAEALRDLGATLVQAQQWEQAQAVWRETQAVIATTKNSRVRTWALRDLGTALVQAQQWEQAQAVIATIEDSDARAEALRGLAAALAASGEQEQLLDLIQRSWLLVSTQEEALRLFPLVTELIPRNPELGLALYKAFTWVDTFLKG